MMPNSSQDTVERWLASRDDYAVVWHEPMRASGADGASRTADVRQEMSVQDCVDTMRDTYLKRGVAPPSERELLLDFIAIHWAIMTRRTDAKPDSPMTTGSAMNVCDEVDEADIVWPPWWLQVWICLFRRRKLAKAAVAADRLVRHAQDTGDAVLLDFMLRLEDRLWRRVFVEHNPPEAYE